SLRPALLITRCGPPISSKSVPTGGAASGQRVPSSEWRMHLALYKARADVGAVMHTHSLNATALACLHRGIPPFHYMVAEFGGDRVACARSRPPPRWACAT
ncbi:MAG: class II aldolase/adducin family protein, partial [Acidobacteria bacterium]|nr:class II aldolase/adducin family protein [Acidobacteriota bacterium]